MSSTDWSCKNKAELREKFVEEYGDLIDEIEMYKHHLDDQQRILCSSYEYGKVMRDLAGQNRTIRIYKINI